MSDIIAGTSKNHGEGVKPSLKRKMSRKRGDSNSNDDNSVYKAGFPLANIFARSVFFLLSQPN